MKCCHIVQVVVNATHNLTYSDFIRSLSSQEVLTLVFVILILVIRVRQVDLNVFRGTEMGHNSSNGFSYLLHVKNFDYFHSFFGIK